MSELSRRPLLDAVAVLQRFVLAIEEGARPEGRLVGTLPRLTFEADRLALEALLLRLAHRLGSRSEIRQLLVRQSLTETVDILARRRIGKNNQISLSTTGSVRLHELAAQEGISTQTLRRRTVRTTGLPPREVLRRERIAKAAGLLASGMKVVAVARECGYRSERGFFTAFRALTGLTPAAARSLDVEAQCALRRKLMPWSQADATEPQPARGGTWP